MINPSLCKLLSVFCISVAIGVGAEGQALLPQFSVPPDDLARAQVGDFTVTFMANGAFVLARDDQYLLDGGIGFGLTGWKRWGDQIRRSSQNATRRLLKDGRGIAFSGTIFDLHRKPTLSCKETVVGLPGGLRFDYELQPMEDLSAFHLGFTFHWPTPRFMGQACDLLPGYMTGHLQQKPRKLLLPLTSAAAALIDHGDRPFVGVVPSAVARWLAFDDRVFQLNTTRLWCTPQGCWGVRKVASRIRMGFDLHLLPLAPLPELEIGNDRMLVDYVGVSHLLADGHRVAQMGLCWRTKPEDPWRYALAVPRRAKLASTRGEEEAITFDGPVGGAFSFRFTAKREDGEFRADWQIAKIKNPLPAEMGLWVIFRKQAKPLVQSAPEQEGVLRTFGVATDARTTVTVETDGAWSHRVQKLWGAESLVAITQFATDGQPSVQKTATIRVDRSKTPAGTGEAETQDE